MLTSTILKIVKEVVDIYVRVIEFTFRQILLLSKKAITLIKLIFIWCKKTCLTTYKNSKRNVLFFSSSVHSRLYLLKKEANTTLKNDLKQVKKANKKFKKSLNKNTIVVSHRFLTLGIFITLPVTSFFNKLKSYRVPSLVRNKSRGRPKKLINKYPFKYLILLKASLLRRYKKLSRKAEKWFDAFSIRVYESFKPLFEKKIRVWFCIKNSILFSLFFFVAIFSTLIYYTIFFTMPDPNNIALFRPKLTTYIYDSQGQLLYKTYQDENRTLITLNDVPRDFINAIVSIEDDNFYQHMGISLPSMVRAAYANYKTGEIVQGGSTITQQLVKNTLLTNEQTLERKIKEAVLSVLIENKYTKNQILEMYLNTVSFGGTSYGIEEASLMYFGKNAKDLDLAESSMLAGLPAAPSEYTPYIDIEKTKQRQKTVLAQMLKNNFITVGQAQAASSEELEIKYPESIKEYPHFVNYVTSYLEQKYGHAAVNNGGLKVYTSLNPEIQDMAQQIVTNEVNNLARLRISNGSALVTKNKTGEVVAMIGSKDYRSSDIDGFVNVTTSLRQPGSSIKPFNYSLGLSNGMTAANIIKDEPVVYKTAGSPDYVPKNYDNKFRGNVTVRRALSNSLNIPAVKTLERNGVDNFIEYVKKFGIDTWNNDYYGLSLALGAAEVRMVDMNGAYGVFANNGDLIKINPILYIETSGGDILEYNSCIYTEDYFKGKTILNKPKPCREKVISSGNAFVIKSILTDFKARSEAFGTNSILNVPGTGSKTGTTNDLKDNWTFGFNEEYTVGTWVGNNDGTPMSYVASGITGASPIWAKIITNLTNENNRVDMASIPSDVVKVEICPTTGQLACNLCKGGTEYFIKGSEPKQQCSDSYIRSLRKKEEEKKAEKSDD